MLISTFLLVLVASAYAAPQLNKAPEVVNNDARYAYAVSIDGITTLENMKCLKSSGYQAVFVRGFKRDGNGMFDTNSVATIRNAYHAGLDIEVYLAPQPKSVYQGSQQLDMMMQGLSDNGIVIRTVWILGSFPNLWSNDQIQNTVFINSILTRARQLGLNVGIYTNSADWAQITNNWTGAGSDVLLWYYQLDKNGAPGASTPNFDDYVAFGGFKTVLVKQFSSLEPVCTLPAYRDVYRVGISAEKESSFIAKDGKIAVGGIGL